MRPVVAVEAGALSGLQPTIQVAITRCTRDIIAEFDGLSILGILTSNLYDGSDWNYVRHVPQHDHLSKCSKNFRILPGPCILVAHNATFDVGFMNVNYERHGEMTSQLLTRWNLPATSIKYKRHGLGPL